MTWRFIILTSLAVWVSACGTEPDETGLSTPDRMTFETGVLPILIRDCAFHGCHGSHERFFQVFGPGHGRFAADTKPLDPLTAQELEHDYQRALSMIDVTAPAHSLILRKPLAADKGGTGHEGTDRLGRDVYQSADDPSLTVIRNWVLRPIPPAMPNGK